MAFFEAKFPSLSLLKLTVSTLLNNLFNRIWHNYLPLFSEIGLHQTNFFLYLLSSLIIRLIFLLLLPAISLSSPKKNDSSIKKSLNHRSTLLWSYSKIKIFILWLLMVSNFMFAVILSSFFFLSLLFYFAFN
jgi:hypothetical protein